MATTFRRVVTGHDAQGSSCLAEDSAVEEGTLGNFNFWSARAGGVQGTSATPFYPAAGETLFRVFRLPPSDPTATPEQLASFADTFFAEVGADARKDTSRHPLMHATPTTDYIMLLSGAVSLLLDTGEAIALKPFDSVVQRATNHAWVVTGPEAAVLVCVMIGHGESRGAQ
jgi:hypothetical protein